jgi:hypothetical protein
MSGPLDCQEICYQHFISYVPFLCRAAEIMTYPRPTANPNASGMKTAPPSQFIAC